MSCRKESESIQATGASKDHDFAADKRADRQAGQHTTGDKSDKCAIGMYANTSAKLSSPVVARVGSKLVARPETRDQSGNSTTTIEEICRRGKKLIEKKSRSGEF